MKRKQAELLGMLVRQYCRQEGLETPLNEYRLVQAWSQVLGKAVQTYTKELKIYNQVLFVKVTSSVLRQELLMNRKALVHKLNEHVKAQVITDIVFR